MSKNVIINVKGIQTDLDNDSNTLELITEGKYYQKGNNYYITYKESEVTGMVGTTTTLKVGDGVVSLMRFGKVNSQFVFQKGQKHISSYETEYGNFTIGVYANNVDININDAGGEIRVGYQIEIDSQSTGRNDFYMLIREAGAVNEKHNRENSSTN
ncbi:MAG: YwiB family protein [Ruminiclostridium sp.]